MLYYRVTSADLTIFTYLFILSAIVLLYTIFKGWRYTNTLSKMIYNLGKDLTAEKVGDFIIYLDAKYIPFRFYTHGIIKSGYRLVDIDENIDVGLKKRLKIMALSKGILVD